MTAVAYTSGFGQVQGSILKSIPSLPTLQKGFYYNPIADIKSDLTSIGADTTVPYYLTWNATIAISQQVGNATQYQSPLQCSPLGIIALLSYGAVLEQKFINFQSQRFGPYTFNTLISALDYPSILPTSVQGEVPAIFPSPFGNQKSADALCIYPQFVLEDSFELLFEYLAFQLEVPGSSVLTLFPSTIYFY